MRKATAELILQKMRDDYNAIASDFSSTRRNLWPIMHEWPGLVRSGDRVLDIGCGNGRAYHLFRGMAIDYTGMDLSPRMVHTARDMHKGTPAEFIMGNMMHIPFPDEAFAFAFAVASFHHIPSVAFRRHALAEVFRVLKPGGRYAMLNWHRWTWEYRRELLPSILRGCTSADYDIGDISLRWGRSNLSIDRYYHAFRLGELYRLVKRAGFIVEEHAYVDMDGRRVSGRDAVNILTVLRKPDTEPLPSGHTSVH